MATYRTWGGAWATGGGEPQCEGAPAHFVKSLDDFKRGYCQSQTPVRVVFMACLRRDRQQVMETSMATYRMSAGAWATGGGEPKFAGWPADYVKSLDDL